MGALAMVGPVSKEKNVHKIPGLKITEDTIAGRYRIEKLLGAGSSGFVVAARHVYLRRPVTLKILTSTTNTHQRAQRRHLAIAHRAAALRGQHIARIVDTGFTEDGTPFVATERLEGRTLAEELAARGQLPAAEAVRWILQACEGLAEAHAAGIVHGDLKPQNLFLAGDVPAPTGTLPGPSGVVDRRILKVLDFGMASPVDEGEDEGTSAWFASPAYLSPEQIRDPAAVDARTDVWALGVILHHLISGGLPFTSDTVSGTLVAVAYDEPALLAGADVPFELARVVQSCLAKQREARPSDVAALARALAPFAGVEGPAMASRVDTVLSTPPPMAMSTSIEPGDGIAAVAPSQPPKKTHREVSLDRSQPSDGGFQRRRRAAIGVVAVAAALAVVGILAPPASETTSAVKSSAASSDEAPLPTARAEGSQLPHAVPSLSAGGREGAAVLDASVAPAAPAPESAPAPVFSPKRTEPLSSNPAPRTAARDMTPIKPRSSLAVREDPYVQGFTHPTRLSERRK
ncbi:MAG TPA: serine/threonine-protein kinase [Labilithrix sp.]|nr:serine/threonine-protein kinase [Labilithrix sp.]